METTVEQTENITEMATPKRRTTKSSPKTRTAKSKVFRSKSLPKPRKRRK